MNVGSLFSGVGGIDLGLERAGHRIVWQCESDPYRRRVLARHWPGVPCWRDVVHLRESAERGSVDSVCAPANGRGRQAGTGLPGGVDLICGGFPCQDLSVAGRRAGLGGDRSSLFFEFARVADVVLGPGGWLLIENVPGLFSSNGGRDFAVLLATLADLGFHDLAWRVLDSRYLGVPQRRRRVFILARRARGRRASEVLLEPESGGGDFEAGREAGARVAASLSRGSASPGVSEPGRRQEDDENIVNALDRRRGGADDNEAQAGQLVANTLSTRYGAQSGQDLDSGDALVAHTLRSEGFDASEDGTGRGTPIVSDRVRAPAIAAGRVDVGAVSIHPDAIGRDGVAKSDSPDAEGRMRKRDAGLGVIDDGSSYTLSTGAPPGVMADAATADRCAHDPKPDGPRYAACGDAVTVNVSHWIGLRLTQLNQKAAA